MPTYAYRCSHCKHEFEQFQRFSDPPIERCPNCRRKTVLKVLHPAPIQFKGSGWYITDSKSKSSAVSTPSSKKKEATGGSESGEPAATKKTAEAPGSAD